MKLAHKVPVVGLLLVVMTIGKSADAGSAGLLDAGPSWSNANWTNMGTGISGVDPYVGVAAVRSLAVGTSGVVYAAGVFTNAGSVGARSIAQWNGNSWTNLGSGMKDWVRALAIDSAGTLYAGGDFTNAGGKAANHIAKWNGTAWTNLGVGVNGNVYSLAVDSNNNVIVGGGFTTAGEVVANRIAKWNGSAWTNLGSGMNDYVLSLAFDNGGDLYAGGRFTTAGGGNCNRVAMWDGLAWSSVGLGIVGDIGIVSALAIDKSTNLYAGGIFTNAGGTAADWIAKWDGSAWSSLDGLGNQVNALVFDKDGSLYEGGAPVGLFGTGAVAKWNGTTWISMGSDFVGNLTALALDGMDNMYVGGYLSSAGGVPVSKVAQAVIPEGDADHDGFPTWWEMAYGLDPRSTNSHDGNVDGDWMTDYEEYVADTSPVDSNSVMPRLRIVSAQSEGGVELEIDSTSTARIYQALACDSIQSNGQMWIAVGSTVVGSGSNLTIVITNNALQSQYRFGVRVP